jgi:1,6-anhydro-N-acetylmuramate kinase
LISPSRVDFDTGPGNVYIDAGMEYLANSKKEDDKDGAMIDKTNLDEMAEDIGGKTRADEEMTR